MVEITFISIDQGLNGVPHGNAVSLGGLKPKRSGGDAPIGANLVFESDSPENVRSRERQSRSGKLIPCHNRQYRRGRLKLFQFGGERPCG